MKFNHIDEASTQKGRTPRWEPVTTPESQAVKVAVQEWHANILGRIETENCAQIIDLNAAHPSGLAQLYAGRSVRLSNLVRETRALAQCRVRAREVLKTSIQLKEHYGSAPIYIGIGEVSWKEDKSLQSLATSGKVPDYLQQEENTSVTASPVHEEGSISPADMNPADLDNPGSAVLSDHSELFDLAKIESTEKSEAFSPLSNQEEIRKGPALLCPVEVKYGEDDDLVLTLVKKVKIWPPLAERLQQAGETAALQDTISLVFAGVNFNPSEALKPLENIARKYLNGFTLQDNLALGQYLHPLNSTVKDLEENREKLLRAPFIQALCGEMSALKRVVSPLPEPIETDRDPQNEHGVGDLDPAQHNILDAVAEENNLLIDTPPASEAVSTVVAMLVDAAVSGRSVAYVPGERRQAVQVLNVLQDLGLENLALDLSETANPEKEVPTRLLTALSNALSAPLRAHDSALSQMREELSDIRRNLGGYMDQLHVKRDPWGVSAYDALQVLADLTAVKPGPRTKVRFNLDTLNKIAADGAQTAGRILEAAQEAGIFNETRATNPWHGVVISASEMVPAAVEAVITLAADSLPKVRSHIARTVKETGLTPAKSLDEWRDQLHMLEGVREVLNVFEPQIFEQSAADMVIATAPAKWRKERALNMKGSTRRRLIKRAKDLIRPGRRVDDLHLELIKVQQQRKIWREYSEAGGWPVLPSGLSQMWQAEKQLREDLNEVQDFFSTAHGKLVSANLDELYALMRTLAEDKHGAEKLPERVAILKDIRSCGLEELVEDIRERGVSPTLIRMELDLAWWASALSYILQLDDRLARYSGEHLSALSQQLRNLDQAQVDSLPAKARQEMHQLIQGLVKTDAGEVQTAAQVLETGAGESYRQVLLEFPLLRRICPIWVLPSALVPDLVPLNLPFDLLVLDGVEKKEISELVPALLRAKQVVVLGDVRRGSQGALALFDKFLPRVTAPPNRVRVNEWVASFLASHDYGADVLPVYLPRSSSAIRLEIVDGRALPIAGVAAVESTKEEVEKVVDLVIQHALTKPDASLAVVALNARHRQRIAEAVISAVADSPALDRFFAPHKREPFIVIDAANAAGLRRDNVILSFGFAKTPHGRVMYDFGQISADTGPTLLIDSLSVVRKDLVIVSSLSVEEIDQSRLSSPGAQMLFDLLEAAQNPQVPLVLTPDSEESEAQPDRLLLDLAERLYSVGLTVIPNLGPKKGLKIPLAIGHPAYPDELLLAVLTDNDAYVAERSLRRRERHQRERLEEYGWVTTMVYSTSVFMDPQAEAQNILDLVMDIVEARQANETKSTADSSEDSLAGEASGDSSGKSESDTKASKNEILGLSPQDHSLAQDNPDSFKAADSDNLTGAITGTGAEADSSSDSNKAPRRKLTRPPLASGLPLTAYSDDQFDDLLLWLRSDGIFRDEEEEITALMDELALERRGAQASAILRNVVRRNPRA